MLQAIEPNIMVLLPDYTVAYMFDQLQHANTARPPTHALLHLLMKRCIISDTLLIKRCIISATLLIKRCMIRALCL